MDDETEAAINEKTAILYGEVERWKVAKAKNAEERKDINEALSQATTDLFRHCKGLKPTPLFPEDK